MVGSGCLCDVATRGGSCTLVLAGKLATPAALQCVLWNQVIWVQTFRGDLGHVLTSSKFPQMEMITARSLQDAESIRLYGACRVQPPFSTGQRPQVTPTWGFSRRGVVAEKAPTSLRAAQRPLLPPPDPVLPSQPHTLSSGFFSDRLLKKL